MHVIYQHRFGGWRGLLFGAACVTVAFALRFFGAAKLQEAFPFTTFTAATALAAWFAGWRTAALVHLAGLSLATVFFVAPHSDTPSAEFDDTWGMVFNLMIGFVICLFTWQWEKAARTAEREMAERARAQTALLAAQEQLQNHAHELESSVESRTRELREALGRLQAFTYSMVHDMRAPLRAINGFANLLESEVHQSAEAADYLRRMRDASQRLDQLITDLQSYSDTASRDVPVEPVETTGFIREVIEQYAADSQHSIHVEGPLPAVMANRALLAQAIGHLLNNALKFVPAGCRPDVRIFATENGCNVRLWIADNGVGIAPEYREKIFGFFQQLHPIGRYAGTGMGLPIAQRAIERMHGAIGLESEVGKGSRFWIELPAAHAESNPPTEAGNQLMSV